MKFDPILWFVAVVFGILPCAAGFGYLAYLFVTVVYLGGGSSCPQNLCP